MTQKDLIKKYLSSLNGQWCKAYDLRGKQTVEGFLGHQADRRARELANSREIEHRINNGYAEYRIVVKYPPRIVHYPDRIEIIEYIPKAEAKQEALF